MIHSLRSHSIKLREYIVHFFSPKKLNLNKVISEYSGNYNKIYTVEKLSLG